MKSNFFNSLSVTHKTIMAVIIVLLGMFAMASVSIDSSNQISNQQKTVDLLVAQRSSLYELQVLMEQSAKLLYRVVYAEHEEDVPLLLAKNENVLSVFENFRNDAISLALIDLPQNSYFAMENEPLILTMRNELYQSVAQLRQGKLAEAKNGVDEIMNNRVHQINTFIDNTQDLLNFQVSDAQEALALSRVRSNRRMTGVFLFIGLLGTGAIGMIGRSVSLPLERLTSTMEEISKTDNLSLRAEITASDEISQLAGQFNRLLAHLQLTSNERVEAYVKLNETLSKLEDESEVREELVAELTQKNTELEQFTYTVSHDLKSPLVTVNGFIGLLKMDIEKGDKERINSDVKHIKDAIHKMGSLLDDLLALSRIGRIVNPPTDCSLNEVLNSVLDSLASQIFSVGAGLEIMPNMPLIHADKQRLEEVLLCLVDNALKYISKDQHPLINISAEIQGQEVIVCIADKGIGIDPRYHEKVFGLFDRLDLSFEGTGIGLALVKRIVEVHKGRVWVESEGLGHGSQFYFSMPVK